MKSVVLFVCFCIFQKFTDIHSDINLKYVTTTNDNLNVTEENTFHTTQPFASIWETEIYSKLEKLTVNTTITNSNGDVVFRLDKYHGLKDIYKLMDTLRDKNPDIVEEINIGTSVEGRQIKLLKIASKNQTGHNVWIDAGIHAREWITVSSLCYLMTVLVHHRDYFLQHTNFYIVPVLNPDGYEYSHTSDRMWRKNRRPLSNSSCIGVDLNRNFPFRYGIKSVYEYDGLGTSKRPCSKTYAGSAPLSEPESRAVSMFLTQTTEQFQGFISLHSYLQSICYPYGYDLKIPKSADLLHYVGTKARRIAKRMTELNYDVLSVAQTGYTLPGNSMDWAFSVLNIPFSYTLELRNKRSFVLKPSEIIPAGKETLAIVATIVDSFEMSDAELKSIKPISQNEIFDEIQRE